MRIRQWKRKTASDRIGVVLRALFHGLTCLALLGGIVACSASKGMTDADIKPFDWNFQANEDFSIQPVEMGRRLSEQGYTLVRYHFRGAGFPEEDSYELRTRNVEGGEFVAPKVHFDNALLMIKDPETGESRPFEIETGKMRGGEGVAVAVYEPDFDEEDANVVPRAKTDLVPHPIEAEGQGGCRLVVRVWPKNKYGVFIDGFSQGESLDIELVAGNWSRRWPIDDFGAGGRGLLVIDPRDSGNRGGLAQFYVDGSSCSVAVEFPYGDLMLPR